MLLALLLKVTLKVLARAIEQHREIKWIQVRMEEAKITSVFYGIILYAPFIDHGLVIGEGACIISMKL